MWEDDCEELSDGCLLRVSLGLGLSSLPLRSLSLPLSGDLWADLTRCSLNREQYKYIEPYMVMVQTFLGDGLRPNPDP